MTRINVVPVEVLSDKHLIAEYKEITRPFKKVVNAVEKGKTINDFNIQDKYVLGKGKTKDEAFQAMKQDLRNISESIWF